MEVCLDGKPWIIEFHDGYIAIVYALRDLAGIKESKTCQFIVRERGEYLML